MCPEVVGDGIAKAGPEMHGKATAEHGRAAPAGVFGGLIVLLGLSQPAPPDRHVSDARRRRIS